METFTYREKEYRVYEVLTRDEIKALKRMSIERNKNLNIFDGASTKPYFEDLDRMVATILKRCFRMTDQQIADMGYFEPSNLADAFVKYLAIKYGIDNPFDHSI